MDYLKALGQLIFIVWALFMIGGTAILFTYMMWQKLLAKSMTHSTQPTGCHFRHRLRRGMSDD